MSNTLKAGFGRINVTPMMGIKLRGYFIERLADGVLDNLEANAVAVSDGTNTAVMIAIDTCSLCSGEVAEFFRKKVSEKTGLPEQALFIHATHSHTAPGLSVDKNDDKLTVEYTEFLAEQLTKVAMNAIEDLKPAKMGYGVGNAPNIAFIRRFRMKDGTVKTNPGVNNPDIVEPIGNVDERVGVLRFDRQGCESIVIANFADHPDTIGGCKVSGDWPAFTRRFVEKAIDNTKCILFNGAEGDVNHVNVHPTAGDFNDMFNDFDGCSRGYGHSRHMGRVVAGAVMQVYDKVNYVDVDDVKYLHKSYEIPSNKPDPKDLPLAHKYNDLHNAGRDDLIPFEAMMLTTVVAEAGRMVRLENAPDSFSMMFSVLKIGSVALFGIPGEPFNGVGKAIKKADGYDLVMPCCLTNGADGYFPMMDAYIEGGYEARSSNFKAGVAEKIIDAGLEMLNQVR